MVNRKLRPVKVLSVIRRAARPHRMTIKQLPGRGKGSHQIWMLLDAEGKEVARFGLTDHPQDLSWTILRRLEEDLEPWLGSKWMEKR